MQQTETRRQGRVSALERSAKSHEPFVVDKEALEIAQHVLDERLADTSRVIGSNQHKLSGYVRVEETGNARNPYCFTGILLPFEWVDATSGKPQTRLRNRMVVIGKYAHDWFEPFCKEILADGINMRLRVRVNLHAENLAFILPGARTQDHAKVEWTLASAAAKAKLPDRLYNYSPEQLARRVYEHFARIEGGSITHYIDGLKAAISVSRLGHIYMLTNGDNIEQFSGSLQRHEVVMDREIRSCVKVKQLNSMADLQKLLDRGDTFDANLQYRD